MSELPLTASCLCGTVKVEVRSTPLWSAHCHCRMCQKAHGAAFVTWVGVEKEKFSIVSGDSQLIWYASSETGKRGHCSKCGTPMLFWARRWSDEMHIARSLFDIPLSIPVKTHAFYDSHVSWTSADPELPKRGGPGGTTLLD